MADLAVQVTLAQQVQEAIDAIEAAALEQIDAVWDAWERGELNAMSVRHRLENVIRGAYRASVNVAVEQVRQQVQDWVPDWTPDTRVFLTPYLQSLLEDVRRNLRDYKADSNELSRRRAVLRHKLSAAVAARRGYTDALLAAFHDLSDVGLQVRKVWRARPDACPVCLKLNGTSVLIDHEFAPGAGYTPYIDLQGPPAHPRCRCYLLVLVASLESDLALEVPAFGPPETDSPLTMSAADIRALPKKVFDAFIRFLGGVQKKLQG